MYYVMDADDPRSDSKLLRDSARDAEAFGVFYDRHALALGDGTMQDIRIDLVAGIETTNHRRRSRRRIAMVAPLMALVATAVLVLPIGDQQSAFAMAQAADGSIRVEVYPGFDQVDDPRIQCRSWG